MRGLSIILALLVITVFVLPVLLTPDSTGRLVNNLAFSALLVRWTDAIAPSDTLAIGREATTLIMLMPFAAVVVPLTWHGPPSSRTVISLE
jgi:hypothetical protein